MKCRKIDRNKELSEQVGFICDSCGKELQDELMLNDETWSKVCEKIKSPYTPKETLLCPECIEKILGREVKLEEFVRIGGTIPPINYWYLKKYGYLKDAGKYILNHLKSSGKFKNATYEIWIETIEENKNRFQDPYENELKELIEEQIKR